MNCKFLVNQENIDIKKAEQTPKNEVDIIIDTGDKALFVECKTSIKNSMGNNDIIVTFGIGLCYLLDEVFNKNGIKKPKNLMIVVSSPIMNKRIELDKEKFWFVDHVFTVYDKDYIKVNNVNVNCGAKSCLGCQLCYHKDAEFYINEKLK